jgi:hypothetical protein
MHRPGQRISVFGRTTVSAPRQSKSRDSKISAIRVAESIPRGFTPRSMQSASCRRKNRFSAWIDRVDRKASRSHRNTSTAKSIRIPETFSVLSL